MKKTAIDYAVIIQQIDQQWKMNIIGSEIKYLIDIINIILKKQLTSSLNIALTITDVKYIHNYMKYKYVYIIHFKSQKNKIMSRKGKLVIPSYGLEFIH